MAPRTILSKTLALGLASCAPLLLGAAPPGSFKDRVLAAQNRERFAIGVGPMHWNENLAADAQRWADHLAATGAFEHAPERSVDPQGENLWAGTKGYYTFEAMVDGWVREKRNYKPGVFPDNSVTGKVADVGHYTQLVWRQTEQVGCARAASWHEDILVCRYSEAGNYLGDKPF